MQSDKKISGSSSRGPKKGIWELIVLLPIMGIVFIVFAISFMYPQYNPLFDSIVLNGMPILMFAFGAFLIIAGISLFVVMASRHIKNEREISNLFFTVGNLFNMIAAGLFAFALTINFSDLFMFISYTIVSIIIVVIGSRFLLKSNKF